MSMSWSDVKGAVAKIAPILGTALGGPAGTAVGGLIAAALGVGDTPDAVHQAIQNDPQAAVKLVQLQNQHEEQIVQLHLQAETTQQAEINKTYRAEIAANDPYVRRWRPTYGYATAITWILQTCALVAAVVGATFIYPQHANEIMTGLGSLFGAMTAMWGIALTVLGINVSKRSQDKQVLAGQTPQLGVIQQIAAKLGGGNSAKDG